MLRRRIVAVLAAVVVGPGLVPPASHAQPRTAGTAISATAIQTGRQHPTVLRAASFNVRTARARHDKRSWLERAPDVAREILSRKPGVVAIQELGPGRADGRKAKLNGHIRQTSSLTSTLKRLGGGQYKLVRSTSYVAPGTSHGTQGARILYDSSRYVLSSNCPQYKGKRAYNASCAFDLPLASGDSNRLRRSAAYALFRDRRTGRPFYVVSAHLDNRHSRNGKTEAKYNRLRARQAAAIANRMSKINTRHRPVILGGDINSWRTDRGRYAPHRALVARNYDDTAAAKRRVNIAYPTVNHWRTKLEKSRSGSGARLDVVMVRGGKGINRYENKMAPVDRARPSDHNMVVADIVL